MKTIPEYEAHIAALEESMQAAEARAQKYIGELEKLRQQYADDLFAERQIAKKLHEERHALQRDYESLRVQKGGFGLKALMLTGFAGFLGGLFFFLMYLLIRPKDNHTAAFEQFRDAHLFTYERAISEGRFESVEQDLQRNLSLPENKIIYPEMEFARKIVGASKRRCEGQ